MSVIVICPDHENTPKGGVFVFQSMYNGSMFSPSQKKSFAEACVTSAGTHGEALAAAYLEKNGYTVLARNYKNDRGYRVGEIDIVARKSKTIVFVEVKTRVIATESELSTVLPEANITPAKLRKLTRIAQIYLAHHALRNADYRFDAIALWIDEMGTCRQLKHMESIFF